MEQNGARLLSHLLGEKCPESFLGAKWAYKYETRWSLIEVDEGGARIGPEFNAEMMFHAGS